MDMFNYNRTVLGLVKSRHGNSRRHISLRSMRTYSYLRDFMKTNLFYYFDYKTYLSNAYIQFISQTHTRTHARTHARTLASTHARTQTQTHTHARTHASTHTHTHTHTQVYSIHLLNTITCKYIRFTLVSLITCGVHN